VIEALCPPELAFRGARQDLEEMLGNLLDNACKWARARVSVRVEFAGEQLQVAIEDDGPGLPPARRAEVLERGRRLDEQVPGTGLGLAIVADLAQLYRGRLVLEEAEGGGLRALLTLPAPPSILRRAS
jgi:signal transduction histidine kinase